MKMIIAIVQSKTDRLRKAFNKAEIQVTSINNGGFAEGNATF